MATVNNRRVAMTKKLLQDSLIELLKEKEISQISIRELCDKADLNRSTFYLHYQDQFDLLNSIEETVIQNTLYQFRDVREIVMSAQNIEIFLSYIQKNGDLFQVLLCKKESTDFKERLIRETTAQLSQSLKFRVDDQMLPYMYSFLMNGCSGILIQWINQSFSTPARKISELVFELCQSSRMVEIS